MPDRANRIKLSCMEQAMKSNLMFATLSAFCALLSTGVSAEKLERWRWSTDFPQGFEIAKQYPRHVSAFDRKRSYTFLKSGKVKDLFADLGKPDSFSRQRFHSNRYSTGIRRGCPLCGTFLYRFTDGTTIYMWTGNMDAITLAMIYSKNNKGELLYK